MKADVRSRLEKKRKQSKREVKKSKVGNNDGMKISMYLVSSIRAGVLSGLG